jgi:hypothetical protein
MSDVQKIVYALERARDRLQAEANALCDQLDYNAELPAEDADCMREAINILEPVARGIALNLRPDPLDTPLPCEVRLNCMTFGKGVPLRLLVDYANRYGPQRVSLEIAAANLRLLRGETDEGSLQ